MLCIGLDISTSIVGISIFENKKLSKLNYIDLSKEKCIFKKAKMFEVFFTKNIVNIKNIDYIYIEDILQSFRRGLSSANTLMKLAKFNGIVSNIVYNITSLIPEYINVNTARKTLEIKIDKKSLVDKKEQVMMWVDKDLNENYSWPTKVISRGPNKGLVKYEKFCYDMADAYVICKAGIIINEQNS